MKDWEYLQEKVMGECVHKTAVASRGTYNCIKCGVNAMVIPNRDFSTLADYCALEDKMSELGEWGYFESWVWGEYGFDASKRFDLEAWYDQPRTQRATLIAEYFRCKESLTCHCADKCKECDCDG